MKKIFYILTLTFYGFGAYAQIPFTNEITPSFGNTTVKFHPNLFSGDYSSKNDVLDVLAISADCTIYNKALNKFSPMRGSISTIFPILNGANSSEEDSSVTVFASIDKNEKSADLGDGGGVFYFKIKRLKGKAGWQTVPLGKTASNKNIYYQNVDFSKLGGTLNNKGFVYVGSNNGTTSRFLVTEDVTQINSNTDLAGFTDLKNYVYPDSLTSPTVGASIVQEGTSIPKYQSHGWPVEIDGKTGLVIGRVHRMGRGAASIVKTPNAFYFVYPGNPSVLMRYTPSQFSATPNAKFDFPGKDKSQDPVLMAYKEEANGKGGFTIPVASRLDSVPDPNDPSGDKVPEYTQLFDSLLVAKDVALRAGATMFANIGDIAFTMDQAGNEVLLISEKGIDNSEDFYKNPSKKFNGVLAKHLQALDAKDGADGIFKDLYGRVLAVTISGDNQKVLVYTEGGSTAGNKFFSNPDKIEIMTALDSQQDVLVAFITIKENIPATTQGRNPGTVPFSERTNEAYFIQLPAEGFEPFFLPIDGNLTVAPLPFNLYTLFESGSKGSMLSSYSHVSDLKSGNVFLQNSKAPGGVKLDTYLSVLNGYNGTDKSMIFAVRPVTQVITGIEDLNETDGFNAWPNPTRGVIQVNVKADYSVTDISGNQVKVFTDADLLNLTELNKGMYFLKNTKGSVIKIVLE